MWLRYEIAADIETELVRDMNLSTANRTLAKFPVYLHGGQREFTISQAGLEDPAYVSMTVEGGSEMVPLPIEIGNVATLDHDALDGRRVVAFFDDNPQRGIVSWEPNGSETLQIWYDRSPATDPSPEQSNFTISDSYVPLLKLLLAAQILELLKQPIGELLKNRIARGLKQWEKFVKSGKQQGIVRKTVGFRPERFRVGGNWSAWPGRVPFE